MTRVIGQRLSVPFEFPVVFTDHVFAPENPALADTLDRLREPGRRRAAVFVDENVARVFPALRGGIAGYFRTHEEKLELAAEPRVIAGGEAIKNSFPLVENLAADLLAHRLDRHAFVLIVGGGAVLDAVGFAASLVHRGLRTVRFPTTVLAQNDAGVGVKTGVNFRGGKNALGTFAPPFAVLNDFQFLPALPEQEWRGGIAEAFKVAMIRDAEFFQFLCAHAEALRVRGEACETAMRELVFRCAALHLEHIRAGGDPFETGRARPLDFGHWAAHKLEALSDFTLPHGDAVAIGICLDAWVAKRLGWLGGAEFDALHGALMAAGFPLWHPQLENAALLDGLRDFQEHLGGELCVTLPAGLGTRREVREMDHDAVRQAVAELKRRALLHEKSAGLKR